MLLLKVPSFLLVFIAVVRCERVKRQDEAFLLEDEIAKQTREHCQGKSPGEWFRLTTNDCRDVVQCTAGGLQALRCPHGLAFDLERQTCDWIANVPNCNKKAKVAKQRPNFNTIDPICQTKDQFACHDNTCLSRERFCDGNFDCADESDEAACDLLSDPNSAPHCDKELCTLPNCFCSSNPNETPYNRPIEDIPQMITITFDDAVNHNNMDLYLDDIFVPGRNNPNGCTIKGTFFVSHKYTNYTAVDELFHQGHEIGLHSISHNDSSSFWSEATQDQYQSEFKGMQDIITNFTDVFPETIQAMRVPLLRTGGNAQFRMMETTNMAIDSTIVSPFTPLRAPYWPYSLQYRMPHSCHGYAQNCPTRSFNIWEMVMNELDRREDTQSDEPAPGCAMVDSCFSHVPNYQEMKDFLTRNFERHYLTNRAPLGLYFHSAFLKNNAEIRQGFTDWIDETLNNHTDVYFLSMTETLQWMTDPNGGPNPAQAQSYEDWQVICQPQPQKCPGGGNNCKLGTSYLPGETVHLSTCKRCPQFYPWVNDPLGIDSHRLN